MQRIMFLLLMLASPALSSAEVYKWIDDKGQVGYADDLAKVPQKYRDRAVTTDKQEQAVEVLEKIEPEKSSRKAGEKKVNAPDDKGKDKAPLFDGKSGESWKQDFTRQKHEIKTLEDQAAGIQERMVDTGKVSRGEYLSLQSTQRDLEVRITKAKKKLDALTEAADRADLPAEFR